MGTLFEKIISGEIPSHRVAEGTGYYAFLDIFPRREGHTLVVPLRGVSHLAALNDEERGHLMNGVVEVQRRLGRHFNTTDFTVCIQEVPHVHVHVLPRTEGDAGGTLMSMWPNNTPASPDHEGLARLAELLQVVN
jgi:histidine triad (HIT) family protein